jgi:hypothetical protein
VDDILATADDLAALQDSLQLDTVKQDLAGRAQ